MLYFHNTSQEIQKKSTYATKDFQLLRGFTPRFPEKGSAPRNPKPRWGHSPQTPNFPQYLLIPPIT